MTNSTPSGQKASKPEACSPSPKPRRPRRRRLRLLAKVICAGLALCFAYHLWITRGSQSAIGTYLLEGGRSYIVIEPGLLPGTLKVREGALFSPAKMMEFDFSGVVSQTAAFKKGCLILTRRELLSRANSGERAIQVLQLNPSKSVSGDWDLAEANIKWISKDQKPSVLSSEFWENYLSSIFGEKDSKDDDDTSWDLEAKNAPLFSYFHRIDDPRIAEYYRPRQNALATKSDLERIRALCADHSGDPYLALHLIELEALFGDVDKATALWADWDSTHTELPEIALHQTARIAWKNLAMAQIEKSHPDYVHFLDIIEQPHSEMSKRSTSLVNLDRPEAWNLPARLDWFRSFFEMDRILFRPVPIVPLIHDSAFYFYATPNFLDIQVQVKVNQTLSTLYLLNGQREDSLHLLASSYRLGQSFNADGALISRMIGMAIRAISAQGLELFALNACETPHELEYCWTILERLHHTPDQETGEHLLEGEHGSFLIHKMKLTEFFALDSPEIEVRHFHADSRFQLLRMAVAARLQLLKTGKFPTSEKGFTLFREQGIPKDPFAKTQPLGFLPLQDDFAVYSIGPDGKDNQAAFQYDSTNGTKSVGDIVIKIPRERKYPFPREGVRADNAAQLLKIFPHGLPDDLFQGRGMPLGILDSTTTQPLMVFSVGPDAHPLPLEAMVPNLPGVYKRNVLYIYEDEDEFDDYGDDYYEDDEYYDDEYYGDEGLDPDSSQEKDSRRIWNLDAYFDPTNGSTSKGDLFIQIPGREALTEKKDRILGR